MWVLQINCFFLNIWSYKSPHLVSFCSGSPVLHGGFKLAFMSQMDDIEPQGLFCVFTSTVLLQPPIGWRRLIQVNNSFIVFGNQMTLKAQRCPSLCIAICADLFMSSSSPGLQKPNCSWVWANISLLPQTQKLAKICTCLGRLILGIENDHFQKRWHPSRRRESRRN